MIPVYLCEDQKEALLLLQKTLENFILIECLDFRIACAAATPQELLQALPANGCSAVYFLDIALNNTMNGIELASQIRRADPGAYLIFTTIHEEMAMETFRHKVEAMDFLIKDSPNYAAQLLECLRHVSQKARQSHLAHKKKLLFHLPERELYLYPEEILYIRATESHRITIYTDFGIYECRQTLREAAALWDGFFPCHRSVLVNPARIRSLSKTPCQLLMEDGSVCPCSFRQARALSKYLK
ncbi:MAG: response regulator transcription factor [Eubacteriales bacterium]|nr:response regulator transcription factor [Eubacteriales bacterium]